MPDMDFMERQLYAHLAEAANGKAKLGKQEHGRVQALVAILLAADADGHIEAPLSRIIRETFPRNKYTALDIALVSFLALRPQHAALVMQVIMGQMQHGPCVGGTTSLQGRHLYHRKLWPFPFLISVFRSWGDGSHPAASSLTDGVTGYATNWWGGEQPWGEGLQQLCVAFLRGLAVSFTSHQPPGLGPQQQQSTDLTATLLSTRKQLVDAGHQHQQPGLLRPQPLTPPMYIHPSTTVKLFIDCLLEVGSARGRVALLEQAITGSPTADKGGHGASNAITAVRGCPMSQQQEVEAGEVPAAKRQRIDRTSPAAAGTAVAVSAQHEADSTTAPSQPHSSLQDCQQLAWGPLLAQACHDEVLRFGTTALSKAVTTLLMTSPSLASETDVALASQSILRSLGGAEGVDVSHLVWAACDPMQPGAAQWMGRMLRLLSAYDLTPWVFPEMGAFQRVAQLRDMGQEDVTGEVEVEAEGVGQVGGNERQRGLAAAAGAAPPARAGKGKKGTRGRKQGQGGGAAEMAVAEGVGEGTDASGMTPPSPHAAQLLLTRLPPLRPVWLTTQLLPPLLQLLTLQPSGHMSSLTMDQGHMHSSSRNSSHGQTGNRAHELLGALLAPPCLLLPPWPQPATDPTTCPDSTMGSADPRAHSSDPASYAAAARSLASQLKAMPVKQEEVLAYAWADSLGLPADAWRVPGLHADCESLMDAVVALHSRLVSTDVGGSSRSQQQQQQRDSGASTVWGAWLHVATCLPVLNHLPYEAHPVAGLLLVRVCGLLAEPMRGGAAGSTHLAAASTGQAATAGIQSPDAGKAVRTIPCDMVCMRAVHQLLVGALLGSAAHARAASAVPTEGGTQEEATEVEAAALAAGCPPMSLSDACRMALLRCCVAIGTIVNTDTTAMPAAVTMRLNLAGSVLSALQPLIAHVVASGQLAGPASTAAAITPTVNPAYSATGAKLVAAALAVPSRAVAGEAADGIGSSRSSGNGSDMLFPTDLLVHLSRRLKGLGLVEEVDR